MNLALVVPGPLDRRSGGYSYDVDLVAAWESWGSRVEVWSLPSNDSQARFEMQSRLKAATVDVVVFDALVHRDVVEVLEACRPHSHEVWVALVHHLAWLEDFPPNNETPIKKDLERRFLETMNGFLFNSESTQQSVLELRGSKADFRPSVVCRPPFASFTPAVGLPHRGNLLFVGNLVPRKNLKGLLQALGLVQKKRPDLGWTLNVAGSPDFDADYASSCRELAHDLGLAERVRWLGRVAEDELERLWGEADLFALPSFHEGWGMAHAEALARGVPSLAVAQGGVTELLGDAALWSGAEPEGLAAALESYLGDALVGQGLRTKARHRARVWRSGATGFAPLEGFFSSLLPASEPVQSEAFDFSTYLEAKASVDTRALHPRVRDRIWSGVRPRTIVELGGGTGTMARRLLKSGEIDSNTTYHLVDFDESVLSRARQNTQLLFGPGRFTTQAADLVEYWQAPPAHGPDLVIAHALLDLFDPRAAAPALADMGARQYWLTHLFDGLTAWEPRIDRELDHSLAQAYHRSMDERAAGGAQGSSRSGRDWLEALPRAGFRVLDAGASDWIVRPDRGAYPELEAVFLRSMLHFFRTSLTARSDVDQAGLAWWLKVRSAQLDRAEASLFVRQLDVAAELVTG